MVQLARGRADRRAGAGRLCAQQGPPVCPGLFANIPANKLVFDAYKSTPAAQIPARPSRSARDLLPDTKFRPVTFVGQRLWDEQVRAVDRALRHTQTPQQSLADGQRAVQIELDSVVQPRGAPAAAAPARSPSWSRCSRWRALRLWASALPAGCVSGREAARAEARAGFLFILPWAFGFLVFTLGPILASLVLSFCDYDVLHPAALGRRCPTTCPWSLWIARWS